MTKKSVTEKNRTEKIAGISKQPPQTAGNRTATSTQRNNSTAKKSSQSSLAKQAKTSAKKKAQSSLDSLPSYQKIKHL